MSQLGLQRFVDTLKQWQWGVNNKDDKEVENASKERDAILSELDSIKHLVPMCPKCNSEASIDSTQDGLAFLCVPCTLRDRAAFLVRAVKAETANPHRLVEFYDPYGGEGGPAAKMPSSLRKLIEQLNGARLHVSDAISLMQAVENSCSAYDHGDYIAIGFGPMIEVMKGVKIHQHSFRGIRMRPVEECKQEPKFLIQNGTCGNSAMWWKRGGCGYTDRVSEAEQFTESAADKLIESTKSSHNFVKWPLLLVEQVSYSVVDAQQLHESK